MEYVFITTHNFRKAVYTVVSGSHILCIDKWWARVYNEEVCRGTDQPPLACIICTSCLKLFGHTAHANRTELD